MIKKLFEAKDKALDCIFDGKVNAYLIETRIKERQSSIHFYFEQKLLPIVNNVAINNLSYLISFL